MSDRDELAALRRMAELEAKSGGTSTTTPADAPPKPEMGWMDYAKFIAGANPIGAAVKGTMALNEGVDKVADWAGGKVVDATGSPAAGTAVNTAIQAGPMLAGGAVAKHVLAPAQRRVSEWLMNKAINPTIGDSLAGKGDRAARILLDEGVNVTRGGMDKLRMMGEKLNSQADEVVNNSTKRINKYDVEDRLRGTEDNFR